MKFLDKIRKLIAAFPNDECQYEDYASFYGLRSIDPLRAAHIIYKPMSEELINDLIASYKREFPKDLIQLYRQMNGLDIFWSTRRLPGLDLVLPCCTFSIYGVPLEHRKKLYQPYNIRIEDLAKPNHSPDGWLKFGSYHDPAQISRIINLYVDTNTLHAYSVDKASAECCILQQWDSLDDCLCSVFDQLAEAYPTMSGVDAL